MKKHLFAVILTVLITALAVCPVAAAGDFTVINGVLTEYAGASPVVTIPDGVERIAEGAFANHTDLLRVTIESMSCTFDPGAVPSGVTVRAYAGSAAESAALRDGLPFSTIEKKYSLTVNFLYPDGSKAADSAVFEYSSGEKYTVSVPVINGFTPDRENVTGTMEARDTTVDVYYSQNISDGWKFENGRIRYYQRDSYLTGTSRTIDGQTYTFDSNGYLISDGGFVTIGSNTYYLENGVCATGYRMIDGGIYCFNSNGIMFSGTSHDGYEFDINGRLIGDKLLITISGKTYYMVNNTLMSGFVLIGNQIYFLRSDFSMVKGTESGGYSFDSEGRLVSGINASELEISPLSAVSADGTEKCPSLTVKFKGLTLTENVHYTLKYFDNVEPGDAKVELTGIGPVSGSEEYHFQILGAVTFTLTVKYVNTMGMSVAPIYTTQVEPGDEFSVPSPDVDGYIPDQKTASGIMGNADMTVVITYSKSSAAKESDENNTETETESPETEVPEDVSDDDNDQNVRYNYSLLLKVFATATILAGGAIVVIINWDLIKKWFQRRMARLSEKKAAKADSSASPDGDGKRGVTDDPNDSGDNSWSADDGDAVLPVEDVWNECKDGDANGDSIADDHFDDAIDKDFWHDGENPSDSDDEESNS